MRIQLSDHFGYTKLLRYSLPSIIMTVFISLYGTDYSYQTLRVSLILVGVGSVLLTAVAILFAAPIAKFFVGYDSVLLKMSKRAFALYAVPFLICGFNIFGSAFFTALNNGAISAAEAMALVLAVFFFIRKKKQYHYA